MAKDKFSFTQKTPTIPKETCAIFVGKSVCVIQSRYTDMWKNIFYFSDSVSFETEKSERFYELKFFRLQGACEVFRNRFSSNLVGIFDCVLLNY